jgi:hypothetical protein
MGKAELKQSFHSLINRIDNEELLAKFYELMLQAGESKGGQMWNSLSTEEQAEILLADQESENPENLISHADMRKKYQQWL